MNIMVAALTLLQFHGPTGAVIDLNETAISSIRNPSAMPSGHWVRGTRCVIVMDNGTAIAVMETCDEVRNAVRGRVGPCTLVCGESPRR